MFPLNHTSSPSQERHSLLCQQTWKMVLDQTLQLVVFGVVNLNGHFFMSIPMPLPTTLPHSLVTTENMKTLKRENTSFESMRSSGHPSPQLSSPQQEAMGNMATTTYKRLASLLADNGTHRTVRPWGGFAAIYPSIELTVSESDTSVHMNA